jgi:hypothetical protein
MIVFTVIDHAACKDNSTESQSAFLGEEPKCACGNYISWSLRPVYVQKKKKNPAYTNMLNIRSTVRMSKIQTLTGR